MVRLIAIAVMLLAAAAQAQQVYTWEDEEGVTHFTDDIATVPSGKAFRTTAGEEISEVRTGGTAKEQAEAKKLQAAQAERDAALRERDRLLAAQAPAAAPSVAKVDVEQQWRTRFRDANSRVRELEEAIAADSQRVETANGMPINFNYGCLYGWGNPGVGPGYGAPGAAQSTASGLNVRVGGPLPSGGAVAGGLSISGASTVRTVGGAGFGYGGGSPAGCAFVSPDYQRVRERLEANRRELVRAKEDLTDLERRASFEAVPREWRR